MVASALLPLGHSLALNHHLFLLGVRWGCTDTGPPQLTLAFIIHNQQAPRAERKVQRLQNPTGKARQGWNCFGHAGRRRNAAIRFTARESMLFAFFHSEIPALRRRSQELGKRENKMSWVPGSPVLGPRAPWKGLRQARPFPAGRSTSHLNSWNLPHAPAAGTGPGAASRGQEPQRQRAHVLPQARRGLGAQAQDSGEPRDMVRRKQAPTSPGPQSLRLSWKCSGMCLCWCFNAGAAYPAPQLWGREELRRVYFPFQLSAWLGKPCLDRLKALLKLVSPCSKPTLLVPL